MHPILTSMTTGFSMQSVHHYQPSCYQHFFLVQSLNGSSDDNVPFDVLPIAVPKDATSTIGNDTNHCYTSLAMSLVMFILGMAREICSKLTLFIEQFQKLPELKDVSISTI